jgi:hypothetical protein
MADIGGEWQRVAGIGREWQPVAGIGREWQTLAENGRPACDDELFLALPLDPRGTKAASKHRCAAASIDPSASRADGERAGELKKPAKMSARTHPARLDGE